MNINGDIENNQIIGTIPVDAEVTIIFGGTNHQLIVGKHVRFQGASIQFSGQGGVIHLGDHVEMSGLLFCDTNCRIDIGNRTRLRNDVRLRASECTNISIGQDSQLLGTRFRTSDSHSILSVETSKRVNLSKTIRIGQRVFIDERVFIYKGVHIGDDSYIGRGSIVTHAIPEKSYAYGRPAIVQKTQVFWSSQYLKEVKS
jgi:acetyltransferase-like isoleucine patch superfamily enzyme